MPLTEPSEVDQLISWLGHEGAVAGLLKSKLPLNDLVRLARSKNLPLAPKPTRKQVVNELVFYGVSKVQKSIDELLSLSQEDLSTYFAEVQPTFRELLDILDKLEISATSENRKNLYKFAAREISDTGLYQRIAGSRHGGC